jgi:hypothetical protein
MPEERKVLQVRAMCQVAKGCAKVVAARGRANGQSADDHAFEYEIETYQKRKLRAIQIAKSIEDRFYFETALQSIIDLCIAANEMDDAGKLFRMISVDVIRDQVLKLHPRLQR